MTISQDVRGTGREVEAASGDVFAGVLNSAIQRFVGWPYRAIPGCILDRAGSRTELFATVVCVIPENDPAPDSREISADAAAAVIDARESMDLEGLRTAHARIAAVKRLKKSPAPRVKDGMVTTVTLGIIFACRSSLPLEELAAELDRLNAQIPSREWPDMIAVGSTGTIQYVVQFPGEPASAAFLPPAEDALANYTPPIYVIMAIAPTGEHTFNKMMSFLIAHLAIFSPGAKLPNFSDILEETPKTIVIVTGYQYNLGGNLVPVPRQYYNDRYMPPPPLRIEDYKGEGLAAIQFLPWQDGGVVILRGKLPLDGIMIYLGKEALQKAGVVRRPSDLQISYVLPITAVNFSEMLKLFQRQSNMVVRRSEPRWVIQKFSDEGTTTPFVARIPLGIMRIRDTVYSDSDRDRFDKPFDQVLSSLMSARDTAREIGDLWDTHARKVASGEIARIQSHGIHISENLDKDLRRKVEVFLNGAVRALKHGMQQLAAELQVDIGFLFKKQPAFENGIAALCSFSDFRTNG